MGQGREVLEREAAIKVCFARLVAGGPLSDTSAPLRRLTAVGHELLAGFGGSRQALHSSSLGPAGNRLTQRGQPARRAR